MVPPTTQGPWKESVDVFVSRNPASGELQLRAWLTTLTRTRRNEYSCTSLSRLQDVLLHNLESGPASSTVVTRDDLLRYFREMSTIRELEKTARAMYQDKKIRGFCHLYDGQVSLRTYI